jgi:hypothetical protein
MPDLHRLPFYALAGTQNIYHFNVAQTAGLSCLRPVILVCRRFALQGPVASITVENMPERTIDSPDATAAGAEDPASGRTWLVSATSFLFVLLQSACTAVIAISGVRVAIGVSALAEATIGIHAPAGGFHRDSIRIPMMILATIGALVNLYVIWRIRSLRARPSSQWRVKPATPKQRRAEVFQIALAIVTLLLVVGEWITHPMVHRIP